MTHCEFSGLNSRNAEVVIKRATNFVTPKFVNLIVFLDAEPRRLGLGALGKMYSTVSGNSSGKDCTLLSTTTPTKLLKQSLGAPLSNSNFK